MKPKITLKRTLAAVTLAGAALTALLILKGSSQPSPRSPATKTVIPYATEEVKQTAASYSLPVRLKIPKINVDTPIDHVGLTPGGDMQAPSEPQHVGWYKFGSRPGNRGSAVIAGHYGPWRDGRVSVFDALHALNKGDRLYVEDEKGATATFVIRELQTYEPDEAAPRVFSSNDGTAHLNLITCQGTWDNTQQTYSERLIVFSDKD